jgi:anti-sigma factor RsiW
VSSGGGECADIFAKLSEYLDGDLPEEVRAHMKLHIEDCAPCVEFVKSLRKSVDLCKTVVKPDVEPGPLPVDCREALLRSYREKIR